MRERELKPATSGRHHLAWRSLPMRERELKPTVPLVGMVSLRRSPCESAN